MLPTFPSISPGQEIPLLKTKKKLVQVKPYKDAILIKLLIRAFDILKDKINRTLNSDYKLYYIIYDFITKCNGRWEELVERQTITNLGKFSVISAPKISCFFIFVFSSQCTIIHGIHLLSYPTVLKYSVQYFSFFSICILVLRVSVDISSGSLVISSSVSSPLLSCSVFDFQHLLLTLAQSFCLSAYITHLFLHVVYSFH